MEARVPLGEAGAAGRKRICIDLRKALPFKGQGNFDDAVHPSPAGYDKIAEVVFTTLARNGLTRLAEAPARPQTQDIVQ